MKKGFTLIELLAVIVILAIIAVIAVPIVLNIINETKESATLRSADFYVGALENEIALQNMKLGGTLNPSRCVIKSNGNAKCDGVLLNVKVDGEAPTGGVVLFENGTVKSVRLTYKSGSVSQGADGTLGYNQGSLQDLVNEKYNEYQKKVESNSADVQNKTAHMYINEALVSKKLDDFNVVVYDDGRMTVGATSIAMKLFDAGVKIGDKVNGYDVSGNITSYTTSGIENSFVDSKNETDQNQPQTVLRMQNPTWTFMGVSDDGEAVIIMDIPSTTVATTPTMKLGATRGYLYGVQALNEVCDKLYTTSKGKARSLNFEDTLKVINYTGDMMMYSNKEGEGIYLPEPLTVREMKEKYGFELVERCRFAPAGQDYYSVLLDHVFIENGVTPGINANEKSRNIIYIGPADDDTYDINYWIADQGENISKSYVHYGIRRGNNRNISSHHLVISTLANFYERENALRPVVELKDTVTFTYADNVITLN